MCVGRPSDQQNHHRQYHRDRRDTKSEWKAIVHSETFHVLSHDGIEEPPDDRSAFHAEILPGEVNAQLRCLFGKFVLICGESVAVALHAPNANYRGDQSNQRKDSAASSVLKKFFCETGISCTHVIGRFSGSMLPTARNAAPNAYTSDIDIKVL